VVGILVGKGTPPLTIPVPFVLRYIADPRYGSLLTEVTLALLDLYGEVVVQSPAVLKVLTRLHRMVNMEVLFQKEMLGLLGALDSVV
ncbi:unnamed protein product, partial [Discosporangium mesarthrocarpum]